MCKRTTCGVLVFRNIAVFLAAKSRVRFEAIDKTAKTNTTSKTSFFEKLSVLRLEKSSVKITRACVVQKET